MKIDNELWNKFDNARLLLCLLVILRHCSPLSSIHYDGGEFTTGLILITLKLRSITVPTFFFISGFLMGHNHQNDNLSDYRRLLSKRFKSLVVPFLLWNVIAVVIWLSLMYIDPRLYPNPVRCDCVIGFLKNLFWRPALYPLWFIRNLICFTLLAPVLIYLVKRLKVFALIPFFIANDYFGATEQFSYGMFYYGAGMFFAIGMKDYWSVLTTKRSCFLLILFVAYSVANALFDFSGDEHKVVRAFAYISGIIGFISLVSVKKHMAWYSSQSLTFFIYCFHFILLSYVSIALGRIIHPHGFGWYGFLWIAFAADAFVSVSAWLIMRRISPRLLSVLTGGRALQPHGPL